MRDSQEILKIVLDNAFADDRIRAVLLTGSRADSSIPNDRFQDYDIIYLVSEVESFLSDQSWLAIFGERLIMQIPEQMYLYEQKTGYPSIHFLILLLDRNRVDITLVPVKKAISFCRNLNPALLLLDKDILLEHIPFSLERGYLIKKPGKKEFLDTCNEFWWVCPYVAKGLAREEISYAREMLEIPVRSMFMKMIAWYIGINTNFSVSFGKSGRFMKKHLPDPVYQSILATYPDGNPENIWNALFRMGGLFSEFAKKVAGSLGFDYNLTEELHVRKYLEQIHEKKEIPGSSQ